MIYLLIVQGQTKRTTSNYKLKRKKNDWMVYTNKGAPLYL
jgi:hypothetical protein